MVSHYWLHRLPLITFFSFRLCFLCWLYEATYPKLPFVVGDFSSCCVVTSDWFGPGEQFRIPFLDLRIQFGFWPWRTILLEFCSSNWNKKISETKFNKVRGGIKKKLHLTTVSTAMDHCLSSSCHQIKIMKINKSRRWPWLSAARFSKDVITECVSPA